MHMDASMFIALKNEDINSFFQMLGIWLLGISLAITHNKNQIEPNTESQSPDHAQQSQIAQLRKFHILVQ